ncbi:MAG TPA: hypothetical protein VGM39_13260 [Kofleriaceae bacterium]
MQKLIAGLSSEKADARFDAAKELRDMTPPPLEALAALVEHVEDNGSIYDEWTDWDGTVVGGASHYVCDRVMEALVRIGTPAFTALVAAVDGGRSRTALHTLASKMPMDALCAAGLDVIVRARAFCLASVPEGFSVDVAAFAATYALAWAHDELTRAEDRIDVLAHRLDFRVGPTAVLAAEELGGVAERERAAAILAELLLRDVQPGLYLQRAAAASLDKLGPVLEPSLLERLVDIAPTKAMFHCWPTLLPALGKYRAAARMTPWLMTWVRDEEAPMQIGDEHHKAVRAAAATAVARLGDAALGAYDELADIYAKGPEAQRYLVLRALPDRSMLVSRLAERWRRVLGGSDSAAIGNALSAISDLEGAAAPLVDALLPYVDTHWRAVMTVGNCGEAARPAVPALRRALENPKLREWAERALKRLGPEIAGPS